MQSAIFEHVDQLLRSVAADLVLPKFRALSAVEILEKEAGEVVSVVDHAVEARASKFLAAILPGSRVYGEESTGGAKLGFGELGSGDVWLIDPLDGTRNFVAGVSPFSIMIALLRDGEPVASWMFDPLESVMAVAEHGAGAFLGGRRVEIPQSSPGITGLRGAILTGFMPPEERQTVLERSVHLAEVLPGLMCAGAEYPKLVIGAMHFALYWRSLPWDHAPGALFLREAGGHIARIDGSPYKVWDGRSGLLAAGNAAIWNDAQRALFTDTAAIEIAASRQSWTNFRLSRP
ncbi:MAG TPA: inositol monophosphatase [Polyangiales bacterium]|nr:inositol monophosphatase [Polyangiales bacterium]